MTSTTESVSAVPHSFVAQFIVNGAKGDVDMKKTLTRFQGAVESYLKENAELQPTIIEELQQYSVLGEQRLIQFTMHALKLPVSNESQERVKSAIKQLEQSGKIVYRTNDNGTRKGRGAGWALAGAT